MDIFWFGKGDDISNCPNGVDVPIPTLPNIPFPLTFAKFAKTFVVVTELLTARFDRIPTDVMFGCAFAVTEAAIGTEPTRFDA
jgi:hypothetical protein